MKPRTFLLALVGLMIIPTYLYAGSGDLDATFGSAGKVTTDFSSGEDAVRAVVLQPDGKIVVAGRSSGDFALARYNTNGTLDTTFGSGGKVTTDFAGDQDGASALALQPDGKIVVAGGAFNTSSSDFALTRYNTNGTLDPTFGNAGKVTTDFSGSDDGAFGVAIQSDGKIVVAGRASAVVAGAVQSDFGLARYHTDGTLDTGFGSGGKVTTDFSGSFDEAHALTIQLDGKIVLAGRARTQTSTGSNDDFALARYNTNGSLDTSFGTSGRVTTDFTAVPGFDEANALAIQLDGKIVAVGLAFTSASKDDFALARYNTNGLLDTSFGSGGTVLTEFSDADVNAQAVAIQLDGTILIAGSGVTSTTTTDFWLSRYRTNGTLDNSFGTAGRVTTDFSGQADMAFGLAIQSDGKIVAAGAADIGDARPTDFALARYEGPTSQDLVSGLSDQVQTLVDSGALNQGQGNSLAVKLTNVLNSLSQGKTKTACNQLEAFINEVNAQVSSGVLTPAQGQALLNVVTAVQQMLGC